MPYSSPKDLPAGAKKMPPFRQHVFMSTFNSCAKSEKGKGDEGYCFRVAYSAADKAKKP